MAGINFEDYYVNEISFKRNDSFDGDRKVELNTDFNCIINVINEIDAEVVLSSKIGDSSNTNSPFEVTSSIVGCFTYNQKESNGTDFERFLSENAIAILFPYLRNLISDVSLKSNEFPSLVLPVINVVQLLEDNKAITINHFNDQQDA